LKIFKTISCSSLRTDLSNNFQPVSISCDSPFKGRYVHIRAAVGADLCSCIFIYSWRCELYGFQSLLNGVAGLTLYRTYALVFFRTKIILIQTIQKEKPRNIFYRHNVKSSTTPNSIYITADIFGTIYYLPSHGNLIKDCLMR
jgi:hypothetical protein